MFEGFEIISSYTRAQALDDGVLVAVPGEISKEAGFRIPVAMTNAVFEDCVSWSTDDSESKRVAQDQSARLWNLMAAARFAAYRDQERSELTFDVLREPKPGKAIRARRAQLVMNIHPGDQGEPIITIMRSDED